MKLLDSPYVDKTQYLTVNFSFSDAPPKIQISNIHTEAKSSTSPYSYILDSNLPKIRLNRAKLSIHMSKLADFEQCTDFQTFAYTHKHTLQEIQTCYFHPKYEVFVVFAATDDDEMNFGGVRIRATHEDCDDHDDDIMPDCLRAIALYYSSENPNAKANLQAIFDDYLQPYGQPKAQINILIKEQHGLAFHSHTIKPLQIDLNTMYNDDFADAHEAIKKGLDTQHKGVVLLHGVAGSGKTNYIKWLTSQLPDKNFIFIPNNLIGTLASPEFLSMLIQEKNAVLVVEDCENYIAERIGGGNNGDVVSTILNIADGILSDVLECQFICTFNAKLTEIDHALLRPGRLIAQYQFDELSVNKANQYLASIGKDAKVDKPVTLAQITNMDNASFTQNKKEKSFGFV